MQLTWLGAAGFRVETDEGAIFLIDPFLSRPPAASPVLPIQYSDLFPIDEIFLTNGRFDHALDTPVLVEQTGAIVHASTPVCQHLAQEDVSPNSLEPVTFNKTKQIGSLRWQAFRGQISQVDSSPSLRALTRLPAYNHDPNILTHIQTLDRQWPQGEVVTYYFQSNDLSLLHFGSAGWIDSVIEPLQPDVALLPVERSSTADDNVVQLATLLKPKVIIPHHWDNYYPPLSEIVDLDRFEAMIKPHLPDTKVYRLPLGQRFNLTELISS